MKKALAITIALAGLVGASPAHAALNLLLDPTFSPQPTGSIPTGSGVSGSPWFDPSGNTFLTTAIPLSGATENAVLPVGSGNVFLDQTVSGLSALTGYTIDLWLMVTNGGGTNGGPGGLLTVKLGGANTTLNVPTSTGYVEYNLNITTANSVGSFILQWPNSATGALDVGQAVVAVPEPTTMVAGALMLLPFAASTLRLRKKTSA